MLEFHLITIKLLKVELFKFIQTFLHEIGEESPDIINNIQEHIEKIMGKENKQKMLFKIMILKNVIILENNIRLKLKIKNK